ncbi:MAG: PEP-CTERM sorting domain-containing protein [Opitutales bacterium]|nr:PEP-CTERM sorting domain-containing protein [Opitutales bacterium]
MSIHYVRIVDIPGSGDFPDSLGNPILDAWLTTGSGGFDLRAIGVIPEPAHAALVLGLGGMLLALRRRRG